MSAFNKAWMFLKGYDWDNPPEPEPEPEPETDQYVDHIEWEKKLGPWKEGDVGKYGEPIPEGSDIRARAFLTAGMTDPTLWGDTGLSIDEAIKIHEAGGKGYYDPTVGEPRRGL